MVVKVFSIKFAHVFGFVLVLCAACSGGGSGGSDSSADNSAPADQPPPEVPNESPSPVLPPLTDDPSGALTPPASLIENDPLQNAQLQTELQAGPDAIYCGNGQGARSLDNELSDCVESAFFNYQPFYYSYLSPGVDSVPFTGIAFNGSSLFRVSQDWFGASDPGLTYTLRECIGPRFGGDSNGSPFGLFRCDELIPAAPLIDLGNLPNTSPEFNIKVLAHEEDGSESYIEYITLFIYLDDGSLKYEASIPCESVDGQCTQIYIPFEVSGRIRVRANRVPASSDPEFATACGWIVGRAEWDAVPAREQVWNIIYNDFIETQCD